MYFLKAVVDTAQYLINGSEESANHGKVAATENIAANQVSVSTKTRTINDPQCEVSPKTKQ